MAAKLEPVDLLPVRFRIASILRKAILAGEYLEGESLSLTSVAGQLGVSRTPVREAFQMLENEGLIELRLNKVAVVKGINDQTIRDHFDLRNILEGEAVARATLKPMDFKPLLESQEAIEALGDAFTNEDFLRHNQLFHTEIWRAAGNRKLYDTLMNLWNGGSFGKTVTEHDHSVRSIREHRLILDQMMKGDPYSSRKEMEQHLMRSMQNILDSFNV